MLSNRLTPSPAPNTFSRPLAYFGKNGSMSAPVGVRILELVDALGSKLQPETVDDVRDWIDHSEWLLALEVLAEHMIENGDRLTGMEWDAFRELLANSGGDIDRFRALLGRDF